MQDTGLTALALAPPCGVPGPRRRPGLGAVSWAFTAWTGMGASRRPPDLLWGWEAEQALGVKPQATGEPGGWGRA